MVNKTDVTWVLQDFEKHTPVELSKYSFKFLKKNLKICISCQEEWPCRRYEAAAESMHSVLKDMQSDWEYHTTVTTLARTDLIEANRRIRVAQMVLSGETPEEKETQTTNG